MLYSIYTPYTCKYVYIHIYILSDRISIAGQSQHGSILLHHPPKYDGSGGGGGGEWGVDGSMRSGMFACRGSYWMYCENIESIKGTVSQVVDFIINFFSSDSRAK
jgi:hypothetical protein